MEPYRELLEFYHAAYIELGRKSVNTQNKRWHNDRRINEWNEQKTPDVNARTSQGPDNTRKSCKVKMNFTAWPQ